MLIVVDLVRAQDPPQMSLVPDKGAVQELAAASPDPAFGDPIHARRPDVAEHGPDLGIGDHELGPVHLLAEVHDQVAGLLGGPVPSGMHRDSEKPDAHAGVLDHGQDIGPGCYRGGAQ